MLQLLRVVLRARLTGARTQAGDSRSYRAGWRTTPNSSSHWGTPSGGTARGRKMKACPLYLPAVAPMFNPSRDQVREFFIEAWRKHRAGEVLTPLASMESGRASCRERRGPTSKNPGGAA